MEVAKLRQALVGALLKGLSYHPSGEGICRSESGGRGETFIW